MKRLPVLVTLIWSSVPLLCVVWQRSNLPLVAIRPRETNAPALAYVTTQQPIAYNIYRGGQLIDTGVCNWF